MNNYMKLEIAARSVNESFARSAVAAFAVSLNPSLIELDDIKTAVSEAVTNCIVHAYGKNAAENKIVIECRSEETEMGGVLHITVTDFGCGIANVEQAVLPFYTTLADDERSGMGFTIMQTFMSEFALSSAKGQGTVVTMTKKIGGENIKTAIFAEERMKMEKKERVNA
ncbi:MAG: anti-sigma F factor [Clostridia bacterium]|nr:anti-sigma F factor [Clostridia bacterium]